MGYNGVGADIFPRWIRTILTRLNPLFLPAVVIHDFDYTYTGGGYGEFTASNFRFAVNMILCTLYPLFNLHSWISLSLTALNLLLAPVKILLYPIICQLFGYKAYRRK